VLRESQPEFHEGAVFEYVEAAFPASSAQESVAGEMRAGFVGEIHLIPTQGLHVAATDMNIFRDKGPEVREVACASRSILSDNTQQR
jgi:hypothetical protein